VAKSQGWPQPPPKWAPGVACATPNCSGGGQTTPDALLGWPTTPMGFIFILGFNFYFFIF
jgi:hypothetical protein